MSAGLKIEAVIFDLDGTILDNEGDWEAAFKNVGKKYDFHLVGEYGEQAWIHEPGLGVAANWRKILEKRGEYDLGSEQKLVRETVEEYKSLVADLDVRMRDGVEELVELIKSKGWMVGLSTGSSWAVVEKELEALGLVLAFDVTTTGEEVYMPKPDPEIYMLTAQKMGVDPSSCLVVEDAIAGVRAAKEIDMKVVALESGYADRETLEAAGADFVVYDLVELKQQLAPIDSPPGG